MKKATFTIAIIATLLTSVAYVSAGSPPQGEKGVIVGDVIDLATFAMKGTDEDNAAAYKNRCELGFPVGIVEESTGKVYVAVYRHSAPASALSTANEVLTPYMGMKVAAQGLKYHGEGVNVIRLSVISEY